MKAIIVIVLSILMIGCCSVKETSNTNTTFTDSTLNPSTINTTATTFDDELSQRFQELYNIISDLRIENNELKGKPNQIDTVLIEKYLPNKPIKYQWSATKVTQRGDSVWVTFTYLNGNGTFDVIVVPAKIGILIPHTTTNNTIQYEEPWYTKIWNGFKDFILGGIIFMLIAILIVQKVRG